MVWGSFLWCHIFLIIFLLTTFHSCLFVLGSQRNSSTPYSGSSCYPRVVSCLCNFLWQPLTVTLAWLVSGVSPTFLPLYSEHAPLQVPCIQSHLTWMPPALFLLHTNASGLYATPYTCTYVHFLPPSLGCELHKGEGCVSTPSIFQGQVAWRVLRPQVCL